jgi:predicted nucleotidyltransferase
MAQDHYLDQIKSILMRAFQDKRCALFLFGSRAAGRHTPVSDFDIAVEAAEDVSREMSLAREMLELSNIPFSVDLVDLRATSVSFGRQVRAEGILLWKN